MIGRPLLISHLDRLRLAAVNHHVKFRLGARKISGQLVVKLRESLPSACCISRSLKIVLLIDLAGQRDRTATVVANERRLAVVARVDLAAVTNIGIIDAADLS